MSGTKVYCIIKKGDHVYFPIKAEWNPYAAARGRQKKSYLPCMPNFFGGTVEAGKDLYTTLIDEVSQESQRKIKINMDVSGWMDMVMGACEKLKEITIEDMGNTTKYFFYSFNADSCPEVVAIDDFEGKDIVILSTNADDWGAECREMSCILKVPVNQLHKNFDNFLEQCKAIGGDYIYNEETIASHSDWNDEGTQDAFKEFCKRYGV